MLQKHKRFVFNLFKWWFVWVYTVPLAVIGSAQLLEPLIPHEGDGMIAEITNFFVTPWDGMIWVILILIGFVIVLYRRAFLLGGYQMVISLAVRSKLLRNEQERYLGIDIINNSPKTMEGVYVRLINITLVGNPHWTPGDSIARMDKFLWSGWHGKENMKLDKDISPGHNAVADLFKFQDALYVKLQTGDVTIRTSGEFILDFELFTIYEGIRYAFLISVGLDYGGDLKVANVRFENTETYDWRISKKLIIEVM